MLNAANEVAVAAFLEGGIAFPRVAATNASVLETHLARGGESTLRDLDDVFEVDDWARAHAREQVA